VKLALEKLESSLAQKIAPVYLLSGDEPLQLIEALDRIVEAARRQGYLSRELFYADANFDWRLFMASGETFSLFGDRRILDLRLPGKPAKEQADLLEHFAQRLPDDAVLIVSLPRLKPADQKGLWFQLMEKAGVFVQVWPLEGRSLENWLSRRMSSKGMLADQSGLRILAARVEGNLLAAAQEVEKLHVLYGSVRLDDEMIRKAVADSARYDVFDLPQAALRGQVGRSLRILAGLRAEGIASPVALWAMARDLRVLCALKSQISEGQSLESAFAKQRVFDNAKPIFSSALQRMDETLLAEAMLLCAKIDRLIKGQSRGDAWEALRDLCLLVAEKPESLSHTGISPLAELPANFH
jgi:DNA polymerase III subunit delta